MKTVKQIIDKNTFVKDGLITVQVAEKCMEEYAQQFKKELPSDEEIFKEAMSECKHNLKFDELDKEGSGRLSQTAFDNYVLGAKRMRDKLTQ